MDDSDVAKIVEGDFDDQWIEERSVRLSETISSRQSTLLQLVEKLGAVLTNTKPQIRCHGLSLLTSTLEKLDSAFLEQEEVSLLVNFYTDRLRDHHSTVPATIRGLFYLSKCDKLTKEMLDTLLDRMFRELMVQQQVVRDRSVVFNMLSSLLFNRLDLVQHVETQFLVGFLQAGEGEKDPRNLSLIFQCTSHILRVLNVDHLKEDVFESLAVYFPIDFTPPKGMAATVTKADLISALRSGISSPVLADFSIPLFMEKLDSDLESAKEDSVESLGELVTRCSHTAGAKKSWLADNGKLLELVWKGLKTELLGIRLRASENVSNKIFKLITQISSFLPAPVGGVTSPEDSTGWQLWLSSILTDLTPHIQTPGTKLNQTSLEIVSAVAGGGKQQSEEVMSRCVPLLVTTLSRCVSSEARHQVISSATKLLVAAAHTGMVGREEDSSFDSLVTVYLETGALHGLAGAAGALGQKHRKELCNHLLSSVKEKKEVGPAVLMLASWDEELVVSTLLPELLNLGDPGLEVLGHLLTGRLASRFLLPVSNKISDSGDYSDESIKMFLTRLASTDLAVDQHRDLSDQVGGILTNLLSWKNRPTMCESSEEEKMMFSKCIENLSSLIQDIEVVNQLEISHRIQRQPINQGDLLELEAMLCSLPVQCFNNLPHLVNQILETPGMWRTKASLINKLPHICDQLEAGGKVQLTAEATGQVAHALALRGDPRTKEWLVRLTNLLGDKEQGKVCVERFSEICSAPSWAHAVTSLLFRQRVWSIVRPLLLEEANKPGNLNHLAAILAVLPKVPRPVLEPELPSLLPLLVRGLKETVTGDSALSSLHLLLETAPALITSHTREIVERCLLLTQRTNPISIRLKALVCLNKIGLTSSPDTVSLSPTVTDALGPALQDHKRVVREAAARARNRWYLVCQP